MSVLPSYLPGNTAGSKLGEILPLPLTLSFPPFIILKARRQVRGRKSFHGDFCPGSQRRTGFTPSIRTEHMPVAPLPFPTSNRQGKGILTLDEHCPSSPSLGGVSAVGCRGLLGKQILSFKTYRTFSMRQWGLEYWYPCGSTEHPPRSDTEIWEQQRH